ncbi:amino acid adenylation domain-containing protein [Streptosporangium saharense]|uniref:amino acid adenylation domain-containing protein n=1 Tax=Streptosporangium saharense TaxID=1706840 RepID=UPI0036ACE19D
MATDLAPTSHAQRALWFLHRWDGPSPTYNMPFALRLTGTPDETALRLAVADVAARHDILRTVLEPLDGLPYQRVEPGWTGDLVVLDVAGHDLEERVAQLVARPYDLERETPWGVWLLRGERGSLLLFVLHHVLADRWSFTVLARDLHVAYGARLAGGAPVWPEPAPRYGDYAREQHTLLGAGDDPGSPMNRQIEEWRATLAGLPEGVPLPADGPPAPDGHTGAEVSLTLPPETVRPLVALARKGRASLFMVLQAAVAALLHRYGAGEDVPLGVTVSGRGDRRWDDLVGPLVNPVVLRVDLSGRPSLRDLVGRVRERGLWAYGRSAVPFDRLVDGLNPARSPGRNPLFQVMTLFEQADERAVPLGDLRGEAVPVSTATAKFDLTFVFVHHVADGTVDVLLNYADAMFGAATARDLVTRFERLLTAAVAAPDTPLDRLDLLSPDEHRRGHTLALGPERPVERPESWVPRRFTELATAQPDRPAVLAQDGELTYGELDLWSNRLARYLVSRGAGPESVVALVLPRGAWTLVAVLATLKAGAAFLPLDPDHPSARNAALLRDAGARLVLTQGGGVSLPPEVEAVRLGRLDLVARLAALPGHDPAPDLAPPHPEQAAYVIYTSGSTGRPKGVVVGRAALATYLEWAVRHYPGLAGAALTHAPLTSDLNVTAALGPLMAGGHVVVGDFTDLTEPGPWPVTPVTFVKCTPSHLALLDDAHGERLAALRTLVVGGEALSGAHLRALRDAGHTPEVVNEYGPTEATVGCVVHSLSPDFPDSPVPVGVPADNCVVHILDHTLRPVPPGVTGELYLGGVQVARGYLGRPGATAARFVADPFVPGARLYRTGDLARRPVDGPIEYLGRVDGQLKVLGNRIEPGEVEAALASHENVAHAAVAVHPGGVDGRERLVGYVVPRRDNHNHGRHPGHDLDPGSDHRSGHGLDPEEVRGYVARSLPPALVPAVVVVLDTLPLTPAGKVDRAALPAPVPAPRRGTAARGAAERRLCRLFAEVLGLPDVGVDEGFFALGGDSIAAIRLVGRARAEGMTFTARDVFERQSVQALLRDTRRDDSRRAAPTAGDGSGEVPVTPILAELLTRVAGSGSLRGYTQARLVSLPEGLGTDHLTRAVQALLDTHDALRSRLLPPGDGHREWRHVIRPRGRVRAKDVLRAVPGELTADLEALVSAALDPEVGEVTAFVRSGEGTGRDRLLVAVHHLAVDAVSWPVLLGDLATACAQLAEHGQDGGVRLPATGTSPREWARHLRVTATGSACEETLDHWRGLARDAGAPLGGRPLDPRRDTIAATDSHTAVLPAEVAAPLAARSGAETQELLLAALALAVPRWCPHDEPPLLVEVEGHGREEALLPGSDLSRTVGWLTSQYPVSLRLEGTAPDQAPRLLAERLRATPFRGVEYGLLRHLNPRTAPLLAGLPRAQIGFNYWGRISGGSDGDWRPVEHDAVVRGHADPALPVPHCLEVNAALRDGPSGVELRVQWSWVEGPLTGTAVRALADTWERELRSLLWPSPASLLDDLDQDELESLQREWRQA